MNRKTLYLRVLSTLVTLISINSIWSLSTRVHAQEAETPPSGSSTEATNALEPIETFWSWVSNDVSEATLPDTAYQIIRGGRGEPIALLGRFVISPDGGVIRQERSRWIAVLWTQDAIRAYTYESACLSGGGQITTFGTEIESQSRYLGSIRCALVRVRSIQEIELKVGDEVFDLGEVSSTSQNAVTTSVISESLRTALQVFSFADSENYSAFARENFAYAREQVGESKFFSTFPVSNALIQALMEIDSPTVTQLGGQVFNSPSIIFSLPNGSTAGMNFATVQTLQTIYQAQ